MNNKLQPALALLTFVAHFGMMSAAFIKYVSNLWQSTVDEIDED